MRYLCVHCDHRFEAEGEAPRRCPSCMRANGVQPVRDEAPAQVKKRSPPTVLIAGVAILAAVGGYFALGKRPDAGERGTLAPLSSGQLDEAIKAAQA